MSGLLVHKFDYRADAVKNTQYGIKRDFRNVTKAAKEKRKTEKKLTPPGKSGLMKITKTFK